MSIEFFLSLVWTVSVHGISAVYTASLPYSISPDEGMKADAVLPLLLQACVQTACVSLDSTGRSIDPVSAALQAADFHWRHTVTANTC